MAWYSAVEQNNPNKSVMIEFPDEPGVFHEEQNPTPFTTKQIRLDFLRKVYGILTIQLLVTFLIVFALVNSIEATLWMEDHIWIVYICMGVALVIMITLACCPHMGRTFPANFIFLGLMTLCESVIITVICWYYDREDILLALGITIGLVAVLTAFAMQTKWDFTIYIGFMCIAFLLVLVIGVVAIFFPDRLLHIIYSSFVILLVCGAIIIDTQLMLIGKHKHSFEPEDYVFAALALYVDIITLFIHILRLIGLIRD
uniref:CSON010468 protein n=1 Tax=Culicoides sonorensis TaxID=179676 RepID=A0A336KHG3_CULSO